MTQRTRHLGLAGIAMMALAVGTAAMGQAAPPSGDALLDAFQTPPESARPRVWWHWLNGNITEDGITKDLEWMHRIGIGGVQTFDASLGTPQVVERRLAYMTPEWKHAFAHAVSTARRLGLEFAIAGSPGWSETGGPWVPPRDAMKKLVWSQTDVVGGRPFVRPLVRPPAITGAFQDLAFSDPMAAPAAGKKEQVYGDVAVLAYPLSEAPLPIAQGDRRRWSGAERRRIVRRVPRVHRGPAEGNGWQTGPGDAAFRPRARPAICDRVHRRCAAGVRKRSLSAARGGRGRRPVADGRDDTAGQCADHHRLFPRVRDGGASDAGAEHRPSASGSGGSGSGRRRGQRLSAPTAERHGQAGDLLGHLRAPRVHRAEAKAGFATALDYYALGTAPQEGGVDPASVIDLTGKLRTDGTLDWTPPAGRWRVLRLGYSLLGTTNHPATAEATGLEVDKYDSAAVRRYLQTYLGMYRDAAGPDMLGTGVGALLTDSIEVGDSNWTPDMIAQFKRLRGYDPTPWLPALTGEVIGSTAKTDAFLYDYRRTLADLIASAHYGTIAAVAHENGLKVYGEALEDMRPLLGDDMAMRAHADIPMAAMWTYGKDGPRPTLIGDDRGAASVAHIYGQNIVAAESLTAAFSPWAFAPADLRPMLDLEFANGINRAGDPHLGPPAARQGAGPEPRHLRPVFQSAGDLGRDGPAPGSITSPAPASCCSRAATSPTSPISTARKRRSPRSTPTRRWTMCRRAMAGTISMPMRCAMPSAWKMARSSPRAARATGCCILAERAAG